MPITFDQERERQREAALLFGRNLRYWRTRQGWAQDTAMQWGQMVDCPHVYSSQWSQLETGKMRNPGPGIFCALGWQNEAIDRHDFGPITDRTLKDRLDAAEPVRRADGTPWKAADFFAAYVGDLLWPDVQASLPFNITTDEAERWSEQLRVWFQRTAREANLSPLEAATGLLEHVDADNGARALFQRVLLGFADYTPEELIRDWQEEGPAAACWVRHWRRSLGLPLEQEPIAWPPAGEVTATP